MINFSQNEKQAARLNTFFPLKETWPDLRDRLSAILPTAYKKPRLICVRFPQYSNQVLVAGSAD